MSSPWEILRVGVENQLYLARLEAEELRTLAGYRWWWRLKWALLLNAIGGLADRARPAIFPKRELQAADFLFGETPVLTAWQILTDLETSAFDLVVELGCGRGLVCLVASLAFGSRAVGGEIVHSRVSRLRHLIQVLGLSRVEAREADFRREPVAEGDLYFLSPVSLEEPSWLDLQARMRAVAPGTRAVVLCEPLESAYWDTELVREYRYSWGPVLTYVQRRKALVSSSARLASDG